MYENCALAYMYITYTLYHTITLLSPRNCSAQGFSNIIKVHAGKTLHGFTIGKHRLIHTLLSHNISVLSMSVDQVILDNPLAGLHGDADIEAGKSLHAKL